ncbi:cytochrome P450 [Mycena leptocephala]|nr:cytochrome P450 [Mycena leptocephala]
MSTFHRHSLRYIVEAGMYGTASIALVMILFAYLTLSRRNTIRNIPGPPSPSWIFGHMLQLMMPPMYGDYEFKWQKMYGLVYRLKGCFGQDQLMISDPASLKYILNSPHFRRGPLKDSTAHLLFGDKSITTVNEHSHKRLRVALNSGFTATAVRNHLPVFEKVAQMLTDQLESSGASTDICPLLSLATISAVAEAILGYPAKDLGEEFLANNFRAMTLASNQSAFQILTHAVAAGLPTRIRDAAIRLPTRTYITLRTSQLLASNLGNQLVREKTDAACQGLGTNTDFFSQLREYLHGGSSLNMLRAEYSVDADHSDKTKNTLTGEEIAAQTALLLIAGQDTTANTLAFGFLELAQAPELQDKLRAEIHSTLGAARTGSVSYDSMPLLNAFIKARETLRMYPAVTISDRIALEDSVIPLASSIMTSTGEHISQISVQKGQLLQLGLASYNRLESRWGADAHEFKPSRWLEGTVYNGDAFGPYANLLSFLGGPRTCLGWRFALLEMQVFICELVAKFSFALPEGESVGTRWATTLQPIMSNGQKGAPLCIKRIV